jgi:hypothetical protein
LTTSFAREICWLAPTESSTITGCPSSLLYRSSDFTVTWQCTREPIGHVGDRLPKPQPRPKLCSTHNCCQTTRGAPSEASQQPHGQAAIH